MLSLFTSEPVAVIVNAVLTGIVRATPAFTVGGVFPVDVFTEQLPPAAMYEAISAYAPWLNIGSDVLCSWLCGPHRLVYDMIVDPPPTSYAVEPLRLGRQVFPSAESSALNEWLAPNSCPSSWEVYCTQKKSP